MKIVFYAPSYKRPEKSITQKLYPFVKLVVKKVKQKSISRTGMRLLNVPIIYKVIYAELEIGF